MSIYAVISLFAVMAALAAMPSASVALVVARAASLGVGSGFAVAAGIVMADLVFVALAILGLTLAVEAMGSLFMLFKCLAAVYLIWFGWTLLFRKKTATKVPAAISSKRNLTVSFLSGFFLTLGDIKAIFFYASLLPAFVDLTAIETMDVVIVGMITIVSVGGVKAVYAICASRLSALTHHSRVDTAVRKLVGSMMITAGAYLIVKP